MFGTVAESKMMLTCSGRRMMTSSQTTPRCTIDHQKDEGKKRNKGEKKGKKRRVSVVVVQCELRSTGREEGRKERGYWDWDWTMKEKKLTSASFT